MSEKVKITQAQADAIEWASKNQYYVKQERLIENHKPTSEVWRGALESLNGMPLLTLVDALRIGYEVEEEYKAGDWIAKADGTPFKSGYIATQIRKVYQDCVILEEQEGTFSFGFIRHAAEEEVQAEKNRLFFQSLGRKDGEFKDGDLGVTRLGSSYVSAAQLAKMYEEGRLDGFYPEGSYVQFDRKESDF